ncbi:MAG TPA: DUF4126 family protein [Vicinamibacterales bacterium]
MTAYFFALLIGVVAGLRTFTAPAAASWAARLGRLDLNGTWLAFMSAAWTPWVFTLLALVELVMDQLPSTPSRLVPMQFGARLVSGALSGASVAGGAGASIAGGAVAGILGAVIGTFGGHALRRTLARSFGRDTPAAFIEDALAIGGALLIISALS